jgi:hypothetical protein
MPQMNIITRVPKENKSILGQMELNIIPFIGFGAFLMAFV